MWPALGLLLYAFRRGLVDLPAGGSCSHDFDFMNVFTGITCAPGFVGELFNSLCNTSGVAGTVLAPIRPGCELVGERLM